MAFLLLFKAIFLVSIIFLVEEFLVVVDSINLEVLVEEVVEASMVVGIIGISINLKANCVVVLVIWYNNVTIDLIHHFRAHLHFRMDFHLLKIHHEWLPWLLLLLNLPMTQTGTQIMELQIISHQTFIIWWIKLNLLGKIRSWWAMEQVWTLKILDNHLFQSQFTSKLLSLNHLLHVPSITKNLLSVSKFAKDNVVYFEFFPNFCYVKDQASKEILMAGRVKNGLYVFDDFTLLLSAKPLSVPSSTASCESSTSSFQNHVSNPF